MTQINSSELWNARQYEKGSFIQQHIEKKVLEHYCFNENSSILDMGCGDGRVSVKVAENAAHSKVLGIDRSADMIAYAIEKYHALPNVNFKVQDVLSLDQQEAFDYVISFFCLHWIENQAEVLKRVKHALKPNGQLLFIIPSGEDDFSHSLKRVAQQPKWQPYFTGFKIPAYFFSAEEYTKLLTQANLTVDSVQVLVEHIPVASTDMFHKFMEPLPLFNNIIPAELIPTLLDDITTDFADFSQQRDHGKLFFYSSSLIVKAHKS